MNFNVNILISCSDQTTITSLANAMRLTSVRVSPPGGRHAVRQRRHRCVRRATSVGSPGDPTRHDGQQSAAPDRWRPRVHPRFHGRTD